MRRVTRIAVIIFLSATIFAGTLSYRQPANTHAQDPDQVRRTVQAWLLDALDKPYLNLIEYTFEAADWTDSSLGCPQPGGVYAQGVYNGYIWNFLFDDFVRYEVHSGVFGEPVVLCTQISAALDVPLRIYSTAAFEVLVPEQWFEFPSNDGLEVLFGPGTGIACGEAGMRIRALGPQEEGVTADDLLQRYLAGLSADDDEPITVGINGRSDTFTVACGANMRTGRVTFFVNDGFAYRVEQWSVAEEFADWDELFQNILAQFRPAVVAVAPPTALPPTFTPVPSTTPSPSQTPVPTAADNADADAAPQATAQPEATASPTPTATPEPTATMTPTPTPEPTATPAAVAAADVPGDAVVLNPLPVAHMFLGDLFIGTLDNLPGRSVTVVPTFERRYLTFAPNGQLLAFLNVTNAELRVLDASTDQSPRRVAQDVHPAFPPAWSIDSQQIAYVVDTGTRDDDDRALLAIYRVAATGGESTLIGGFAYRNDCDLATADPADAAYFQEVGPGGVDNVLAWLPDGRLLVSTGCAGGLGALDPAQQSIIELGEDLHGGILSPDRTRFLARTDTGMALLDLAAWQRSNIPLGTTPQQLAWSVDGNTVYYVTATPIETVMLDDPALAARGEAFFGMWPVTVSSYGLTLVQLNLQTGAPVILWQGTGRGIGRIAPAPDDSGLLFTLIPSARALAEVFFADGDAFAAAEARPAAVLYWLPAGTTTAQLLAYAGQPAFGAVNLFGGE